jgi:hypothetical protein
MRQRLRIALAGGIGFALIGSLGALAWLPAGAADASTSAATKNGTGPFSDVSFTVAKTKGLVNEVVEVTWKNAKPSEPAGSTRRQFMQLMQCWGDDPSGPRPEQCQFGAVSAISADPFAPDTGTRQVGYASTAGRPRDPLETHPADEFGNVLIPFESVDGRKVGGRADDVAVFFDIQASNELSPAPTRGDGTGQEFFEVQTNNEAPGLGCGQLVSKAGQTPKGRSCWLVIVPRGDTEVNGTKPNDNDAGDRAGRLQSSPLSATNWANRVQFPLEFQPLGGSCKLGTTLTPILGHENATEAISRWQQSLCAATGTVFDFSQLSDDNTRGTINGGDASLGIVGAPLPKDPADGKAVYAPIAISGFGFAYNLELRTLGTDPPDLRLRSGQRVTDLKLNARLVAKLLTQSYRFGVTVPSKLDEKIPRRMEDDPEFRELNPWIEGFNYQVDNSLWTIVTPLTPSDATALVWKWIAADPDARAFVAGTADKWGMVVNPDWKGADLDTESFPKLDQACRPALVNEIDLCVADAFPYSGDAHEAVLAATKGDTLARNSWDRGGPGSPPGFRKSNRQPRGGRGIMVFSDTGTAARYNLPMAQLKNANGKYVGPDNANLLAAVAKFKKSSTPGVLTPDPTVKDDQAYPLTMISYAVTVPAALSTKARTEYSGFLKYAAGAGQKPGVAAGSLPSGYAPMPKSLISLTNAAATAVKNFKPPTPKPEPTPKPSGAGRGTNPGGGGSGGGGGDSGSAPPPATGGEPTPAPSDSDPLGSGSVVPTPAPTDDITPTSATPALPENKAGNALLWVLVVGLAAATAARMAPYAQARRQLRSTQPRR